MKYTLRILLFVIAFLSGIPGAFAERFRVMDKSVVVYAEPERINNLGEVHRGEEYESEGMEGTLYVFRFKGRKAYVASYCCKPVEEIEEPAKAAPAAAVSTKDAETPNYFKWLDDLERKRNANANMKMPESMALVIGLTLFLGMIVGLWTLFGTRSCDSFFDKLAGRKITWCSKATHFRPLIIVFGSCMVGYVTQNINITLTAAAIYEAILLIVRSKKLGGLRPAIVEALYLFFYGMGTLMFCWMYLIFLFLGVGSVSTGSKGRDLNRRCGRCAYYVHDIPTDRCAFSRESVNPNDYCESFKPR